MFFIKPTQWIFNLRFSLFHQILNILRHFFFIFLLPHSVSTPGILRMLAGPSHFFLQFSFLLMSDNLSCATQLRLASPCSWALGTFSPSGQLGHRLHTGTASCSLRLSSTSSCCTPEVQGISTCRANL